jgi:hypothetical protein
MSEIQLQDYGDSGLSIQYAMVDQYKKWSDKTQRPDYILWEGLHIKTGDSMLVPTHGIVRAEFLEVKDGTGQGFDLDIKGWIELAQGEKVSLLRTWYDPLYEPVVVYPFHSSDRLLRVWNVYKRLNSHGQINEEKWTGNAGFWVDRISEMDRIYHCSHGLAQKPDFEALVFRVTVTEVS